MSERLNFNIYQFKTRIPRHIMKQIHDNVKHENPADKYFYISRKDGKLFNVEEQCTAIFNYTFDIFKKHYRIADDEWGMIYAGMGCYIYFTGAGENIKCFFLHGDNFGQYGIDDRPYVNDLIRGKKELTPSVNE
jgi:hypothetical protein